MKWLISVVILGVLGGLLWHFARPEPIDVRVVAAEPGLVRSTVANTRVGTIEACRRAADVPECQRRLALRVVNSNAVGGGRYATSIDGVPAATNERGSATAAIFTAIASNFYLPSLKRRAITN